MKKETNPELEKMRNDVIKYIDRNYKSMGEFCIDKKLSKATISNLINRKKDFQLSTLRNIARAIDKEIVISLKKLTL
jgi:hypothetical protein